MTNLYFTISGFFVTILIITQFFFKERIRSKETKIYGAMLLCSILDLSLVIVELLLGYLYYNQFTLGLIIILNKIDLACYICWIICLLLYIAYISVKETTYIKIKNGALIFGILSSLVEVLLPIEVLNENGSMAILGIGVNYVYIIVMLIFLIILCILIKNIKRIFRKKYTPVFILIILLAVAAIIRVAQPTLIIIPAILAYVNLIMYHTIENPDVKMLQEVEFAREQAENANHAKTDFLSSMSHEIRTPLNAIVGFSQALLEEELPNSAKEEVEDIISASNTLLELVNSILDISKIEANKIEIIEKEYSFKEVYNELITLTKARLGEKNLEFSCSYDDSIPPVLYGDHVRIKQIILNLLTNSVKYTKQGFIDFKVSSFKQNGICRLIISVEDSGIGIKQENIDKLFTKFERFDEKNTTIEGTGLGLAITKKLIDLMSGKIIVQSLYKKGSKFTVILDQKIIDKKSLEPVINKEEPKSANLTEKRILIVDDNSLNLKVAARLLATYKMQVDTCLSGEECISKIEAQEKYDLIFLDDMMPKLSGVETLKKLKERKDFCIPTIALTANAITGMREKYLSDGFDDYLSKPIEKEELNRIIQKFLQK